MPFIQIYTYAIASKEVEKPQWTSNRDVHLQYWWLLQHESTPASAAHVAPSFPQETPGESQGLQDFIHWFSLLKTLHTDHGGSKVCYSGVPNCYLNDVILFGYDQEFTKINNVIIDSWFGIWASR